MNRFVSMFAFISTLVLAGCSGLYVGKQTSEFQKFSCVIEEDLCGIRWNDDSHILYEVISLGENRYKVSGEVDYQVQKLHTRQFVSFYLLLMSADKVVYEKKIKTFGTKYKIDFEVELDEPVIESTIEKLTLWNRS